MSKYPILVDWNEYKFHCSSLPIIMKSGRAKDENLGETAKSKLREIWIEETFGRKNWGSKTKYTEKGIKVESDSLEIVSKVTAQTIFKNIETLSDADLVGTPDVIDPYVKDIKSSWDIFTFFAADEKKARDDYYWQMVGYMILTNTRKADLIYVLGTTPAEITEGELYKASFHLTDEEIEEMRANFVYEDVDENYRVHTFAFLIGEEEVAKVRNQVKDAREYLRSLDEAHLKLLKK